MLDSLWTLYTKCSFQASSRYRHTGSADLVPTEISCPIKIYRESLYVSCVISSYMGILKLWACD
jgi:hypothetical protein